MRGLTERREPFLIWYLSNKLILCGETNFFARRSAGAGDFREGNRMDNNELSTNLASLGTDCISRQQAINALSTITLYKGSIPFNTAVMRIEQLPPIQPEIVRCKDCGHYRHGLCMKASMCVNKSENGFCDWAERRKDG